MSTEWDVGGLARDYIVPPFSVLDTRSGGGYPDKASVRRLLHKVTIEQMFEAIDITASRFRTSDESTCRYFFGVCHRITHNEER